MLAVIATRISPETVPQSNDIEYLNEESQHSKNFFAQTLNPMYFVVKSIKLPYYFVGKCILLR